MERLTTTETTKKYGILWKTLTFALCGALTLSNISCGSTTQEDVREQEEEIERINSQLTIYIKSRKELVEKYNKLLKIKFLLLCLFALQEVGHDLLKRIHILQRLYL